MRQFRDEIVVLLPPTLEPFDDIDGDTGEVILVEAVQVSFPSGDGFLHILGCGVPVFRQRVDDGVRNRQRDIVHTTGLFAVRQKRLARFGDFGDSTDFGN